MKTKMPAPSTKNPFLNEYEKLAEQALKTTYARLMEAWETLNALEHNEQKFVDMQNDLANLINQTSKTFDKWQEHKPL